MVKPFSFLVFPPFPMNTNLLVPHRLTHEEMMEIRYVQQMKVIINAQLSDAADTTIPTTMINKKK
jgi:hypothetical protein